MLVWKIVWGAVWKSKEDSLLPEREKVELGRGQAQFSVGLPLISKFEAEFSYLP